MELTVRELIIELRKYDGGRTVCLGYDDIGEPVSRVKEVRATRGGLFFHPVNPREEQTQEAETIVLML